MKIKTPDLSQILKKYSNVWVALDDKKMVVVASGKSPKIAIEKARSMGVQHPVVTRVPEHQGAYIV